MRLVSVCFSRSTRRTANRPRNRVSNRLGDRQSLDSLRSPLGGNLLARDTPHLLGIVLEERAVQAVAKSIDEKIFE